MNFGSRNAIRIIVLLLFLAGAVAAFFDFPSAYNQLARRVGLPGTREFLPFHFGIDLQGGTHLVYEADASRLGVVDVQDAVEGARDVIERRVNAFGVTEPVVQTNRSGDAWRIIVELAGVKDVREAIQLIGETPILEFREQNTDPPRDLTDEEKKEFDDFNNVAKEKAEALRVRIFSGKEDFVDLVQEFSDDASTKEVGGDLGFIASDDAFYEDVKAIGLGKVNRKPIEKSDGLYFFRVDEDRDGPEEVQARHLLICFEGAESCTNPISKDEALAKITELKKKATTKNFETLVKENSTEPGAADRGGDLGWFRRGMMVPAFEDVVFAQRVGTISDVVESPFGYHLIYKQDARAQKEYHVRQIRIQKKTIDDIRGPNPEWKTTTLSGKHLKRATVQFDQNNVPEIGLEFTSEGSELFAEITKRNIQKPIAIFLDGASIVDTTGDGILTDDDLYAPIVQQEITGGKAVITGVANVYRAREIARRLNAGALPIPITLISQATIGPSLGSASIQKSLVAGIAGFLFVILFMILFYRLPGLLASCALVLYLVFLLFLFKAVPVTLTLSGIAGVILSLGMAVDANILIFERFKEEMKSGALLRVAITEGFKRAWPSIRDGNITTLIASGILFWFSSSLVKGFALTLGIGVFLSMFSAIVVTRYFLLLIADWVQRPWFYGVSSSQSKSTEGES